MLGAGLDDAHPGVGAEPQGPAGVLPAGGLHAEPGLDRRQDRQRLRLLGGPAGLLRELDGGVGVGQRGGPVAVAPAGRGQPGQQERQQPDRTRRAGAAHPGLEPPPGRLRFLDRRVGVRRDDGQLVDRQRVRRRQQGLAGGEQRPGPGGVVGEREGQGVDQRHRHPLRRRQPLHVRGRLRRRGAAEMLVADRQAQQRGLAAHRRGPGRVGRAGPVGQVQQLVAGLGRLAAPHLHAALQVARRRDQRGVVGLDQGQVEQRGRRRDVAGGLRGECRLQQPADARRARRAQPRRTFEERERGDVVVAGGRAAGCGGELRGHVLVRAGGRRGEVERPALGGSESPCAGRGRRRAPGAPRVSGPARRRGRPRCGSAGGGSAVRCHPSGRRGRRGPVGRPPRPARGRRRRGPARPAPRRRRRPRCRRRRPAAGPGGWRRAARRGAARRRARAGC